MILNAIAEKLKRQSKEDFKGRHFEARLIVQAVTWYLRYPLSYRDLEEMFRERGFELDHSTINRWVLTYAPMIESAPRPHSSAGWNTKRTVPSKPPSSARRLAAPSSIVVWPSCPQACITPGFVDL